MTDNAQTIISTFRQMKKIYRQIYLLLSTADDLMAEAGWVSDNSTVLYDTAITLHNYEKWLPFIIRRTYINDEYKAFRKYIAVMTDDKNSKDFVPVVIGTTVVGQHESTPDFRSWDAYWWWQKKKDGEIIQPKEVYLSEDRELAKIHSFSHDLVKITDGEKLGEHIIHPLLNTLI